MNITNLTRTKINTSFLQKVVRAAFVVLRARRSFSEGGGNKNEEISLVLVGDAKIKALNKKYLRRNRVTNILSFEELNEIFICLPQAKRQSKLLKTPLKSELMRLLVHGIVHLKGYEHERGAKEAARMLAVENKILKNIESGD